MSSDGKIDAESTARKSKPPRGRQWTPRFPAYKDSYVWRAEDSPDPAILNSAIFVVHGIGSQAYVSTAVSLRNGVESVISHIQLDPQATRVPAPFTTPGHWADYDDFHATFEKQWKPMGKGEREFFDALWKRRLRSKLRTFGWLILQALKLLFWPRRQIPGPGGPLVGVLRWLRNGFIVMPISILVLTYVTLRHPKIMAEVLADIRVYLAPQGEVENAIAQKIDNRVGQNLLKLLGMDWDFNSLPLEQQQTIAGKPHIFRHVTWVAHSLGSVISYNVLSDLLHHGDELRKQIKDEGGPRTLNQRQQLANIERFQSSLQAFYTIGSPLEKTAALWPQALRPWPTGAAARFQRATSEPWWTNVYHLWDPISGSLRSPKYFPDARNQKLVQNRHGRIWTWPLLAHVRYWSDRRFLWHVLMNTYDVDVKNLRRKLDGREQRRRQLLRERHVIVLRVPSLVVGAAFTGLLGWVAWKFGLWPVVLKLLGIWPL